MPRKRSLDVRLEEAKEHLDRLELERNIRDLRDKYKSKAGRKRRRR